MDQERLDTIKLSIQKHLSGGTIFESIRDVVETYLQENPEAPSSSSDEIIKVLKEQGIFQSLLSSITESDYRKENCNDTKWGVIDGEQYLHVRLNGGRAFVDNAESSKLSKRYSNFFSLQFGHQRHRSSFHECTCEPSFDEDFLLPLDAGAFGFPPHELIEICTPLHIAVFREDHEQNTAQLVGENIIDWRKVLNTGILSVTVELCASNAGVPVGIVDLELAMIPKYCRNRYTEDEIERRLEEQRAGIMASDREFLLYTRRWWNEYQSFRPSHKKRNVKVFASTTNGRMVPVNHFVSPLQGEGITSPLEAARFVSLIRSTRSVESTPLVEGSETSQWLSPLIFLSQRVGHPCNHANLLCSLLLGFGLEAYCCIGENAANEITIFIISHIRGSLSDVVLWNPLLGERYSINGEHALSTIDCMYNHKSFYANIQPSSKIMSVSFDVENEELWKPLNPLKLRIVPKFPYPSLLYKFRDSYSMERRLDIKLRNSITSHRTVIGVQTVFDDTLSFVLSQALEKYELQKLSCQQEDLSLFQDCVKGTVGPGMTFKAIPVNVTNESEDNIMTVILSHNTGSQILDMVGEDVKFGVRSKIYAFPENVLSVWIMVAVSYSARI